MCCGSLGDLIDEREAQAALEAAKHARSQRAAQRAAARAAGTATGSAGTAASGGGGGGSMNGRKRRRRRLMASGDSKTPPGSGPVSDAEDGEEEDGASADTKSGDSPLRDRAVELRQMRMKRWNLNLSKFDDMAVLHNMVQNLFAVRARWNDEEWASDTWKWCDMMYAFVFTDQRISTFAFAEYRAPRPKASEHSAHPFLQVTPPPTHTTFTL
jgi:hypothetical protein